jgi:hypothetical protein
MASALENVLNKIREAAADLITLDVTTLSGSFTIRRDAGAAESMSLEEAYKKIESKSVTMANLDVIAFSHIALDADTVSFVKSGLGEGEMALVKAHNEAVDSAQAARRAFIQMLKDVLGV